MSDLYKLGLAVAETLVDDFSHRIAIVFHFPNAVSYLETYLLGHFSFRKLKSMGKCHSMMCPTPFFCYNFASVIHTLVSLAPNFFSHFNYEYKW